MKRHYVAIIDRDADSSVFGVTFPDFPGCVSVGDSLDDAIDMGTEALQFHIEGMTEDGEPIPEPTPLDRIAADPDLTVSAIVPIPVTLPGTAKRVNVTLDAALLAEIDAVAANRSRFLAEAARAELKRRRGAV